MTDKELLDTLLRDEIKSLTLAEIINRKYGDGRGDTYQNGVRPGMKKLRQFHECVSLRHVPQNSADEPIAYVKLFDPCGSWTWYVCEVIEDSIMFGLVNGFESELGNFCLSELSEVKGHLGIGLELDMHFLPCPLDECRPS